MMRAWIAAVALSSFLNGVPSLAQEPHRPGAGHSHQSRSAEEWIRILENPERDEWQKPEQVVASLGLRAGDAAADIGAGSGYFSVRLAAAVGSEGRLYAVDVVEGLIDHLNHRAREAGLSNLKGVLGAPDDPRLDPASVDLIFICDVVHHIENRSSYYEKLSAALRPDGRLAIVDFYKRDGPVGPPKAMRIAKADMIAELAEAGFSLAEEFDYLPEQYFLVFRSVPKN